MFLIKKMITLKKYAIILKLAGGKIKVKNNILKLAWACFENSSHKKPSYSF